MKFLSLFAITLAFLASKWIVVCANEPLHENSEQTEVLIGASTHNDGSGADLADAASQTTGQIPAHNDFLIRIRTLENALQERDTLNYNLQQHIDTLNSQFIALQQIAQAKEAEVAQCEQLKMEKEALQSQVDHAEKAYQQIVNEKEADAAQRGLLATENEALLSKLDYCNRKLEAALTNLAENEENIESLIKSVDEAEAKATDAANTCAAALADATCDLQACSTQALRTGGTYLEMLQEVYMTHAHPVLVNIRAFQVTMLKKSYRAVRDFTSDELLPAMDRHVVQPISKIYTEHVRSAYMQHVYPAYQQHAEQHVHVASTAVSDFYRSNLAEHVELFVVNPVRTTLNQLQEGLFFAVGFLLDDELFPWVLSFCEKLSPAVLRFFSKSIERLSTLPFLEATCGEHANGVVAVIVWGTVAMAVLLLHPILELFALLVFILLVLPMLALIIIAFNVYVLFIMLSKTKPKPRGSARRH